MRQCARDSVITLVRSCKYIFLLPSYHDGTLWEISQIIKDTYLRKTAFVMPAEVSEPKNFVKDHWENTAPVVSQKLPRSTLPAYDSKGCVFRLNEEGSVIRRVSLHSLHHRTAGGKVASLDTDSEIPFDFIR